MNGDKAERRRQRTLIRAAKRQAKAAKKLARGKHKHDDNGRQYTKHIRGKLYLITECTCGKIRAKDKLE